MIGFLNPWLLLFDSRAVSLSQEMVPEIRFRINRQKLESSHNREIFKKDVFFFFGEKIQQIKKIRSNFFHQVKGWKWSQSVKSVADDEERKKKSLKLILEKKNLSKNLIYEYSLSAKNLLNQKFSEFAKVDPKKFLG